MHDPVMCCDGHSYERCAIERWLAASTLSPATGLPLASVTLVPNHALRGLIAEMPRDAEVDADGDDARCATRTRMASSTSLLVPIAAVFACASLVIAALASGAVTALGWYLLRLVRILAKIGWFHRSSVWILGLGTALCGLSLRVRDERLALGLVCAGVPLATISFIFGLVCAVGGDSSSALLLSRLLLLSGFAFCAIGIHLTRAAEPTHASQKPPPEAAEADTFVELRDVDADTNGLWPRPALDDAGVAEARAVLQRQLERRPLPLLLPPVITPRRRGVQ